jgi:asparagine synthetase B (glutamine-hydrolysing)
MTAFLDHLTATLRGILHRTRNELDEASQRLRRAAHALVAFSAGVDSTYLLAVAHAELGAAHAHFEQLLGSDDQWGRGCGARHDTRMGKRGPSCGGGPDWRRASVPRSGGRA